MTTRTVRRAPSDNYVMASASTPQQKQSSVTQITVTPLSVASSGASTSQNTVQSSRPEDVQGTQYEHVTVVTQLGQQPIQATSRCYSNNNNTASTSVPYTVSSPAGASALQVHPPATLTQQVQLSVPALAGAPIAKPGTSRGGGRSQAFRSNGTRSQKTPLSAMLPIMGRGSAKQLVNMTVIGDDGPTVRQHLQQQQQKARLQQQLAMQAKQKAEEAAKQIIADGNPQILSLPQPSSSGEQQLTSVELKVSPRAAHVQRPYTPRISSMQRQRAAVAEAMRQFQLKGSSSTGLEGIGGSLPPISLGPSRPPKMSRVVSQSNLPETRNGAEVVTVLQSQQQPAFQSVRQVHYRPTSQSPQLVRSNSQPVGGQSVEQVYQVVTNEIQHFSAQPVGTQLSHECQQMSSNPVLSGVTSQQMKNSVRKRPQRLQSQVRVTFLEPPKSADFACSSTVPSTEESCASSIFASQVPTSQGVYVAPRQAVGAREISQGEQFYSSCSPTATNTVVLEGSEIGEQQSSQSHQVLQHNNAKQKHSQHQIQVVPQHHFQQTTNQSPQMQSKNSQNQTQVSNQLRIPHSNHQQQLQEVIVSSPQQQQSFAGQQQFQQISNQSQMQLVSSQQHLRTNYQQQQRVVQLQQQLPPQRSRRQNVIHLDQRQQPLSSHLQQQVQTQTQSVQQQQSQPRQTQQLRQHPQQSQVGYIPRFQQPRSQQAVAAPIPASLIAEQREGVVRHHSPVPVAHHVQLRSLPPGVMNRSGAQTTVSQRTYTLPQHVAQQQRDDQTYSRKLYFLKTSIKALTYKNAALCDEIARLNQRIQTVSDQRRMLAKRLQHHERNRIRRIQTKLKKKAALEAKLKAFQEAPLSINVDAEPFQMPQETEAKEFNDMDSERTCSPTNPSPSSSVSNSCFGTPDSLPNTGNLRPGALSNQRQNKSKPKLPKQRKLENSLTAKAVSKKVKMTSPG